MNMKYYKLVILFSMVAIFLTGCLSLPIGDGNSLKITKDGITVTDKEGDKHRINVDKDGKKVNIEGFGQDKEDKLEFGENLELPKDFPKEIPIAKNATFHQVAMVEGDMTVSYLTDQAMDDVVALYDTHYDDSAFFPNEADRDISEFKEEERIAWKQYSGKRKELAMSVSIVNEVNEDVFVTIIINFTKEN